MEEHTPRYHVYTPLLESISLSRCARNPIHVKMDCVQPSGSFKIRGIGFLCQEGVRVGYKQFVCSSGGNAGLAAAYAAFKLGIPIKIFIPKTTPAFVKEKLNDMGAHVMIHGENWNEAHKAAVQESEFNNSFLIHPYDHPLIWKGHATLVAELALDMKNIPAAIVVSVGGGGLACGIIEGLESIGWTHVTVITVETEGADCFNASILAKKLTRLSSISSIAKSLGALEPASRLWELAQTHRVISLTVSDKQAVSGCLRFLDAHRVLVEPACGAALAAVYEGLVADLQEKGTVKQGEIVVVACGGNLVTLDMLQQCKREYNL